MRVYNQTVAMQILNLAGIQYVKAGTIDLSEDETKFTVDYRDENTYLRAAIFQSEGNNVYVYHTFGVEHFNRGTNSEEKRITSWNIIDVIKNESQ